MQYLIRKPYFGLMIIGLLIIFVGIFQENGNVINIGKQVIQVSILILIIYVIKKGINIGSFQPDPNRR